MFVAIEGPTGAGKTTLARRLSEPLGCWAALDPFEANPFLEGFYQAGENPASHLALLTEITFLLLRAQQLRTVARVLDHGHPVIADWAMIKQLAYAHINLGPQDRARLRETLAIWTAGLPAPDLLIHLHADPATLQARIARRGRAMESGLTNTHLARLADAYELALAGTTCPPVLEVDATAFDVFDDAQLAHLAERITTTLASKGAAHA